MIEPVKLVCAQCLRPIFDNGEMYLHWNPQFDSGKDFHLATPWMMEWTNQKIKDTHKGLDSTAATR